MKNHSKKVGAIALALALSASTGITSLVASAAGEKKFTSTYDSWEEVLADGAALNVEIASEGFVLLKNENAALPLADAERNVTLLGSAAYTIQSGGGGSGGLSRPNASFATSAASNIVDSLTNEGFKINPRVQAKYGNNPSNKDSNKYMDVLAEGEGLVEFGGEKYAMAENCFLAGADDNFTRYGDVAIINLLRTGSEGFDNLSYNVAGHSDYNEHDLTLTDAEREILAYAKYHKEVVGDINKIVVIVNSPAAMELGDIQDDAAFDSVLWIGTTGWNGADAVAKVLTGEVNPSGHTVDFWTRDIKTDPTYYNFSNLNQAEYLITGEYGTRRLGSGNTQCGNNVIMGHTEDSLLDTEAEVLDYAEGIFMGYRYYESVAADIGGEAGEAWYQSVTAYPFGYGLSYTTFAQEIVGVEGDLANANGEVTVTVKVTNTGKVAGKDVVQLYNTPEYHDGGIDKAEVNLVGFTKTDIIKAGKSQNVKVTIAVKDLAEFDYNDANDNKNNGYELEEGKYVLSIRKNSHEVYDTVELQAGELLTWDEDGDPTTPNNIFSQEEGVWEMYNTNASHWTASGKDNQLHRNTLLNEEGNAPSDLKKLAWVLTEDNVFTDEAFNVIGQQKISATTNDYDNPVTLEQEKDYMNVWTKTAEDVKDFKQAQGVKDANGLYDITIDEMIGVAYDDAKWTTFLNQLTWAEITGFIRSGSYSTAALNAVGKPQSQDNDGPQQLKGRGTGNRGNGWAWVCSPVLAATWNVELCYEQGKMVGIESMWQGGLAWYAPAMNTHRNQLAGRNFEYYSQDGIQGGLIAAAIVKGATDQGMRVYIKHSFLNDQETSRLTANTLCNEQAIRQIYAKPFELSIKKGNANGIMAAFNYIGLQSSASYAINIQLYTNEWGYKGATVTDYFMGNGTSGWWNYSMIRGCVFPLGNATQLNQTYDAEANMVKSGETEDFTTWYWARETAKRILYVYANSNTVKNGFIATKALAAANVEGKTNEALALKVIDTEYLTNVFGKSGYTLTATNLPEGLTINNKGEIAGTATQTVNNANVSITIQGANGMAWISGSVNTRLTLTEGEVALPAQGVTLPEAGLTATYNTAYEQTANVYGFITEGEGQNWYPNVNSASAAYVDKYIGAATYAATGLPKGISINRNTGVISGTPTEVGEFEVTLTATLKQVYAGNSNRYQTRNVNFSTTYTITVGGGYNVTVVDQFGTTYLVQATATGEAFDIATIDVATFKAPGAGMTAKYVSLTANGEAATGTLTEATTLYVVWEFPDVTLIDGEWWIHGENSGIQAAGQVGAPGEAGEAGAAGQDGKDGKDGADGETPTIEINADGYWVINGEVTNVKAAGEQGPQGEQGVPGANGQNGAPGKDGADGKDFLAGCSSVIGVGSVAMIALLGAAYIVRRKENN